MISLTNKLNRFYNSQIMGSMWQSSAVNGQPVFVFFFFWGGGVRFKIFTQNWLLGNVKYFDSFNLKSLDSSAFRQNVTRSEHTDHPRISFLIVWIDL